MTAPASVLVVGGGIAGVSTAAALRAGGFDGRLLLVEAGGRPYDRPPLSKDYLVGKSDLASISLQPDEWYDAQAVQLLTRSPVVALRPAEGGIELDGGRVLSADRVVLATGGRAARPAIPGSDSPRVQVLRTVDDADRLREAVSASSRVLVVGAGLIGAEVASTLLTLGVEVTLVDPVTVPLAPVLGDDVATWLHGVHAERGITTITSGVTRFDDVGGGAIRATLTDGGEIEVDHVVLGVGMTPETGLAEAAGLRVDRGVLVDAGQTTSHPSVLAVGDPARPVVDGVPAHRPEHWEAAQHDAVRAAATILGAPAPTLGSSWFWSDRHGHHVEVVGSIGRAQQVVLRGTVGAPPFSAFGLSGGLVTGALAVDDSNAVRAARRMIDRGVRVDVERLGDPATDLRKLLRG